MTDLDISASRMHQMKDFFHLGQRKLYYNSEYSGQIALFLPRKIQEIQETLILPGFSRWFLTPLAGGPG